MFEIGDIVAVPTYSYPRWRIGIVSRVRLFEDVSQNYAVVDFSFDCISAHTFIFENIDTTPYLFKNMQKIGHLGQFENKKNRKFIPCGFYEVKKAKIKYRSGEICQ